jgi:hypothetical protein
MVTRGFHTRRVRVWVRDFPRGYDRVGYPERGGLGIGIQFYPWVPDGHLKYKYYDLENPYYYHI